MKQPKLQPSQWPWKDWFFWFIVALSAAPFAPRIVAEVVHKPAWDVQFSTSNLLYFQTGLLVWYYLAETRRMRIGHDAERWPLLVAGCGMAGTERPHPIIYLKNMGGGACSNIQIEWHFVSEDGWFPSKLIKRIAAMSAAPHGLATIASFHDAERIRFDNALLHVRCELPGSPGEEFMSWWWVRDTTYGDGFRLTTDPAA